MFERAPTEEIVPPPRKSLNYLRDRPEDQERLQVYKIAFDTAAMIEARALSIKEKIE